MEERTDRGKLKNFPVKTFPFRNTTQKYIGWVVLRILTILDYTSCFMNNLETLIMLLIFMIDTYVKQKLEHKLVRIYNSIWTSTTQHQHEDDQAYGTLGI